jgi:hypothetical protein
MFHTNPPCGFAAQIAMKNPRAWRISAIIAGCPQGEAMGFYLMIM